MKGIFCDSNSLSVWHESEDINTKSFLPNFSWFQFCIFKLCMILCFIASIDYCIASSLMYETFCANCSHLILKWLQPNSFGGSMLLRGELQKMQKSQILKILRVTSIQHQGVYTRQVEQKPGGRGRGREWASLGVHPLSWLLSNNWLEKVSFVSVPHTSSNRLLLSNQDKGCTPTLALPLGPALLNLRTLNQ